MEKIKIAIVIINYNGNNDTLECLASIDKFCTVNDYTVFLVDNASLSPIPEEELQKYNVPIQYIQNQSNLGFAGGNNFAISKIKDGEYDYLFLLNNDTVLVDDSTDRLIKTISNQTNIIGGIVNYYYDTPSEIWQAGSFLRASRLSGKDVREFDTSSNELVFVDAIPGSSMIIPWEIVKTIGLFDERYFAYYEEMDFCERAIENGYKVAFLPNTRLLHKVGRASSSKLKHYLRSRNTLLFYSLHQKKLMGIAYMRVIFRTFRETISCLFRTNYFTPALWGIKDFKRGYFNQGSIYKFFK